MLAFYGTPVEASQAAGHTDIGQLVGSDGHEYSSDDKNNDAALERPFSTNSFGDCDQIGSESSWQAARERCVYTPKKQKMAPKKAPAWKVDVMLLEM